MISSVVIGFFVLVLTSCRNRSNADRMLFVSRSWEAGTSFSTGAPRLVTVISSPASTRFANSEK
jgi:hypothetical protein